jgi:spore coat polysaccharide biosynthesis protein SpsF
MSVADIAIVSFGVTAYELAAEGVPTVHFCLSEDHMKSAEAFVARNVALTLSVEESSDAENISRAVAVLLNTPEKRNSMRCHAWELHLGEGCRRAAEAIAKVLEGRP